MDNNTLDSQILGLFAKAKHVSRMIGTASPEKKNHALACLAESLWQHRLVIMRENSKDLQQGSAAGLSDAMMDRLELTPGRIESMATGVKQVAALKDITGEISDRRKQPSGICVERMRVPLGVIGIIYESRPNITVDAAALCLKAGNSVILRGGSEALLSNLALTEHVKQSLIKAGLSGDCVQIIPTADRKAVGTMLRAHDYIDVIIPRGGKSLIKRVVEESSVPIVKHLDGICHVFVDRSANIAQAISIAVNAKTQRFGVCNTMETLLVHAEIAEDFLPRFHAALSRHTVQIRGCPRTRGILPSADPATEEDWSTEYLAPVLSVRVVDSLQSAIDHINCFGSHHTDSIVTSCETRGEQFLREVDSSSVMVNTSTRFADGYQYGLGAEIGISTDKLHARGPVGLEGLTTQKFIVRSDGAILF